MLKGLIRVAILAGLAAVFALPAASASAATRCPATFQVLHDDQIGAMKLPAGAYTVTASNLSCASASSWFATFLADYDGDLPYPWRENAARKSFTTGTSGFSVRVVRSPPTPPTPPTPPNPTTCGGAFSVLHNDRIGAIPLPKGQYTVKLLSSGVTCGSASTLFAQFLDYPSGNLPAPWAVSGVSSSKPGAMFADDVDGHSFRVDQTSANTGGGGRSGTTCGIFRVLHDDHVGSLYVPKGSYEIILPAGSTMTCAQGSKTLLAFLDAEALPRPWILDGSTGTFTRGYGSSVSFRLDPVSGTVR